jgi:hypothetical protein
MEVEIHVFWTSALSGVEWLASNARCLAPCFNRTGSWMEPRAGMDAVLKAEVAARAGN